MAGDENPSTSTAAQPAGKPTRRRRRLRRLLFVVLALAALLCLSVGAVRASVAYYRIDGEAMRPCLGPGQTLWVNKAVYFRVGSRYLFHPPRRGEIVVLHRPIPMRTPGRADIHRVIGLPGETVAIRDGRVFINGNPLEEPYVADPARYRYPPGGSEQTIPEGMIFVLGDNRNSSADSHIYGPVPLANVIGRAAASC